MSIDVATFDLSLTNPQTGEYLTANVYYVDGVTDATGARRALSVGQLVMALCLQRAAELETKIVDLMESMNDVSTQLEYMTEIEEKVIEEFQNDTSAHAYDLDGITVGSQTATEFLRDLGVLDSSQHYVRNDSVQSGTDILYDDFITALESKMDEKNSFSQQSMIELQSLTNKRDQSYDMVSNILKTFNTQLTGTANNM